MRNTLTFLLVGLFAYGIGSSTAQSVSKATRDSLKTARIAHLVDTFYFRFSADMALPMGGQTRHLTGGYYDLKVSKDTVVAYLPYYGRAYVAPMDPTKGGIEFTSKDFTYTTTARKKGGWDISFQFKDAGDVKQMQLSVSTAGYASLQVTSINRQSISFNGEVRARKKGR